MEIYGYVLTHDGIKISELFLNVKSFLYARIFLSHLYRDSLDFVGKGPQGGLYRVYLDCIRILSGVSYSR